MRSPSIVDGRDLDLGGAGRRRCWFRRRRLGSDNRCAGGQLLRLGRQFRRQGRCLGGDTRPLVGGVDRFRRRDDPGRFARLGDHGEQVATAIFRHGYGCHFLGCDRLAVLPGDPQLDRVVARRQRRIEDCCEIAAVANVKAGDHLVAIDDFEFCARFRFAGNHCRAIGLDAQDVEARQRRGGRCLSIRRSGGGARILLAGKGVGNAPDERSGGGRIGGQRLDQRKSPGCVFARLGHRGLGAVLESIRYLDSGYGRDGSFRLGPGAGIGLRVRGLAVGKKGIETLNCLDGIRRQPVHLLACCGRGVGGSILDRLARCSRGFAGLVLVRRNTRHDKEDHEDGRDAQHQQSQQAGAVFHHGQSPSGPAAISLGIASVIWPVSQAFSTDG